MHYVIVGAGPAGVVAAETLRRTDPSGSITLVGDEPEPPYSRMALPYLLADQIDEAGTHLRHDPGHYQALGIEVCRDSAVSLAPQTRTLTLAGGDRLSYDRLLIATGAQAVQPPVPGIDLPGVVNCWTLADARTIAGHAAPGARVVLMGAGFIGCIVLQALAARGVRLSVVEMAERMLPRMMDPTGAEMLKRWCESKGVQVLTASKVTAIEAAAGGLRVVLGGSEALDADLVVCAAGVTPNIGWLAGSGVATGAGVLVDRHLAASVPGIHAAGDVAEAPDFSTGEGQVHAIQPTAVEHGRIAALNMAGRETRYRGSLSMNVLNTLGLVSSSFGLWMGTADGDHAAAADADRFTYIRLAFDDDVLVGALALGLTQHVGVLRGLIQTRVRLGPWKDRLIQAPHRVMAAYLDRTQGRVG